MNVVTSNLAIRFYRYHGWNEAILFKYLKKGKILDSTNLGDEIRTSYFIFDANSHYDLSSLYENEISAVERTFNDHPTESDLDFLKRYW